MNCAYYLLLSDLTTIKMTTNSGHTSPHILCVCGVCVCGVCVVCVCLCVCGVCVWCVCVVCVCGVCGVSVCGVWCVCVVCVCVYVLQRQVIYFFSGGNIIHK